MDAPGEKLLLKMWETLIEKGVGKLLTPLQSIREGKARNEVRRDEILMLAQAETDAASIRSGKKRLDEKGVLRIAHIGGGINVVENERIEPILMISAAVEYGREASDAAAARSEINVSRAILNAEEQLANDTQTPPERTIDDDWLFSWRERAGNASTDYLQKLWGSVLAGEVKSPGTYSLRTLEFLKTLSKEDAELISKIARFAVAGCIFRAHEEHFESKDISVSDFYKMQELGVLSGVEALGLQMTFNSHSDQEFKQALVSHNKVLIVAHKDASKIIKFDAYVLTSIGREILGLGYFEPDVDYLRLLGKKIAEDEFSVSIADFKKASDTQGRIFNSEKIN